MKMIKVRQENEEGGTFTEFYLNPKYIVSIKDDGIFYYIEMHDGTIHKYICAMKHTEIVDWDSRDREDNRIPEGHNIVP